MKIKYLSLFSFFFCLALLVSTAYGQTEKELEDWSRRPGVVSPGNGNAPPSDAIVLYGGPGDIDKWETVEGGGPEPWTVLDDPFPWKAGKELTVVPGSKYIATKQKFGDVQLHIEWRTPTPPRREGQDRGNSGIFLMCLYEVQVLDSYENETYYNGQAGAVYKQYIPLVNASRPPGEWQEYDIVFTAPRFNEDGGLDSPAWFTVFHNGVLIQNHVKVKGPTSHDKVPEYKAHPARLPLMLQEHGNAVSYRNIWIRQL